MQPLRPPPQFKPPVDPRGPPPDPSGDGTPDPSRDRPALATPGTVVKETTSKVGPPVKPAPATVRGSVSQDPSSGSAGPAPAAPPNSVSGDSRVAWMAANRERRRREEEDEERRFRDREREPEDDETRYARQYSLAGVKYNTL